MHLRASAPALCVHLRAFFTLRAFAPALSDKLVRNPSQFRHWHENPYRAAEMRHELQECLIKIKSQTRETHG